ncbi:unnamed protein product [Didymodactylos carnosus]|uniref:Uncharacterized protein n=1 Tax=Didymodactylos carnosus TaxID=1234261 RepID=A0A813RWT6_9BILA|nr:unnamed protein product [Didymodactylos carnosus]CAF0787950.1 unnamed protein product [Didymodactylos carnosus]CAF3540276.1 unnamed protein product [Didymodactylos carnosus]CAF3571990.1 unnamed protein product [Didymodactylos carnosus]
MLFAAHLKVTMLKSRWGYYASTNLQYQQPSHHISDCIDRSCDIRNNITYVSFALIILIIIFIWIFCECCIKRKQHPVKYKPLLTHRNYIKMKTIVYTNDNEEEIFQTGVWSGRYKNTRGQWIKLPKYRLKFIKGRKILLGQGDDNIGQYKINGVYSSVNLRMALTVTYIKLARDNEEILYEEENNYQRTPSDYKIEVQLYWDTITKQFYGKWYVEKQKLFGKCELRQCTRKIFRISENNSTIV